MDNRYGQGQYRLKGTEPRKTRSIMLTQFCWERLLYWGERKGITRADLIEDWMRSANPFSTSDSVAPPMDTAGSTPSIAEKLDFAALEDRIGQLEDQLETTKKQRNELLLVYEECRKLRSDLSAATKKLEIAHGVIAGTVGKADEKVKGYTANSFSGGLKSLRELATFLKPSSLPYLTKK